MTTKTLKQLQAERKKCQRQLQELAVLIAEAEAVEAQQVADEAKAKATKLKA